MAGGGIAIVNSSSGKGDGDGDELAAWCAALDLEPRDPGDDVRRAAETALAERPPVLAVHGGDGTVRAVAAVIGREVPLLVAPGGTFNHFAKSLGIADLDDASRAVRDGTTRDVSVGIVNEELFLNTCVVGWYPEMVRTRERLRTKLPRPLALIAAFVGHVPRMRPFVVDLDGTRHRVWTLWVGVGEYGMTLDALAERTADDVLDVRLLLAHARWSRIALVADLVRGRLRRSDHLERFVTPGPLVAEVDLRRTPSRAVPTALDAEVLHLRSPLRLDLRPAALRVYAMVQCHP